jgi:hypothetical protein
VAAVIPNGTGPYAAPSGACLRWRTGTIVHNHRLSGRTFLVPLDGDCYSSGGKLTAGTVTALLGEANQLLITQSASLVVWSRPFLGTPAIPPTANTPGRAANPARLGSHGLVTSVTVKDTVAVLRSRRD